MWNRARDDKTAAGWTKGGADEFQRTAVCKLLKGRQMKLENCAMVLLDELPAVWFSKH